MQFEAGDSNLYRYAKGTPVNLTDPSGKLALIDSLFLAKFGGDLAGAFGLCSRQPPAGSRIQIAS